MFVSRQNLYYSKLQVFHLFLVRSSFYESTTIAIEVSNKFNQSKNDTNEPPSFDDWFRKYSHMPLIGNETDEELGKYYRDLQKEYNDYLKDLNWHNGFSEGPDPCKNREVVSLEWTVDDKPKPLVTIPNIDAKPKDEILPTPEAAPIVETTTIQEHQSAQLEKEPEPTKSIPKDTIDVDLLGYYPKPFDVSDTWVQCKLYDCNKWFENVEIRQKHAAKYHV